MKSRREASNELVATLSQTEAKLQEEEVANVPVHKITLIASEFKPKLYIYYNSPSHRHLPTATCKESQIVLTGLVHSRWVKRWKYILTSGAACDSSVPRQESCFLLVGDSHRSRQAPSNSQMGKLLLCGRGLRPMAV